MDEHARASEVREAVLPPALSAIEMYDPRGDASRYTGRAFVRLRTAEFVPVATRSLLMPDVYFPVDGVFWGLRAPDDVTTALSTSTHDSVAAAATEAAQLVAAARDLEAVPVRHPATGHHSLWFVQDERVVLVAARRWRYPVGILAPRILRMLGRAVLPF